MLLPDTLSKYFRSIFGIFFIDFFSGFPYPATKERRKRMKREKAVPTRRRRGNYEAD